MAERLSADQTAQVERLMNASSVGSSDGAARLDWRATLALLFFYREVLGGRYGLEVGYMPAVCVPIQHLCAFLDCDVAAAEQALEELKAQEFIRLNRISEEFVTVLLDDLLSVFAMAAEQNVEDPDSDRERKAPRKRMQRFIERFEATCQYCTRHGTSWADPDGRPWTKDHVRPVSFGGDNSSDNLVLACWSCNSSKRDQPVEHFLRRRAQRIAAPPTAPARSERGSEAGTVSSCGTPEDWGVDVTEIPF